MKTSIRQLKAKLSEHIRAAAAGKDVTVSIHGKAVAKIIAADKPRDLKRLMTEPNITWNGSKPTGLVRPALLRKGKTIAAMVMEDRR
jgi:prevent-host-death family protein